MEDDDEKEEGEVIEPHPLVSITDIKPEDIPEVPTNKFLMRGGDAKTDDKRGGKIMHYFHNIRRTLSIIQIIMKWLFLWQVGMVETVETEIFVIEADGNGITTEEVE